MAVEVSADDVSGVAFRPARFLGNPHAQTLLGTWRWPWGASAVAARAHEARSETRRVRVDEHTEVELRVCLQDGPASALVLVHGLAGCARSSYMLGTATKAFAAGLHVVRLNVRNCGGTEHLTPTFYHAGLTDDLAAVAREVAGWEQVLSVHAAGFSLGGNIALKWAGDLGSAAPDWLGSVAAVSPALHLPSCSAHVDGVRGARVYRDHLLGLLRETVVRKAELLREGALDAGVSDGTRRALQGVRDARDLADCTTIRAFDERFVAGPFGFRDADDYYERASALDGIGAIAMPALIIHARDDVLVPPDGVESLHASGRARAHVRLLVTERGGHCAFVGARTARDRDRHWAENRLVAFAVDAARRGG